MCSVANAVDVDEQPGEIKLILIGNDERWIAAQNAVSMFDGCEAVINISHIPVEILHSSMAANMLKEGIQHLPLKSVVVLSNACQINSIEFCNLMDRE